MRGLINDWNRAIDQTLCLDFGILIVVMDIAGNRTDDVRTTPPMQGEFIMWNSVDLNGIRCEVIKALRLRIFYYDLEANQDVGSTYAVLLPTSIVATRPPRLPCLGESDDILDNNLKWTKLKLNGSGIDVNARKAF